MDTEPNFRSIVAQRKKALDRCLRKMGQHGLVNGSDGQLVNLHEALRAEFDRQVAHYKGALHKLEQLSLVSGKHGHHSVTEKPGSAKAAYLSEASHQRLLQLSRGEVQERVIKNKTLLTCSEPAVHNLTLHRLLRTLRSRVEADKVLLFHDTELRKMAAHTSRARLNAMATSSSPSSDGKSAHSQMVDNQQMAMTLCQFSYGYSALLRLAREVAEAQGEISSIVEEEEGQSGTSSEEEEEGGLEGEGDYLSVTSTLSIMKKMKVVSRNGIMPGRHTGSLGVTSARLRNGWLDVQQTTATRSGGQRSGGQRKREAGSQGTPSMENGGLSDEVDLPQHRAGTRVPGNTQGTSRPPVPAEATEAPVPSGGGVAMLEQEVLYLRQELAQARDQIRKLQGQEKQLRERLVGQAHQQFQMGNAQFEDLSLGQQRPTELIRRYGDLYLDSRVEALDALDRLVPLTDLDVLKLKILFSVIVLSFKATQQSVGELRGRLRHLLNLPPTSSADRNQQNSHRSPQPFEPSGESGAVSERHSPSAAAEQLEQHITAYLCKTADTFEVAEIVFEVCQQIYATLFDYPCLKACSGLLEYVSQCVRVAWGLCVQRSPYTINYEAQTFDDGFHTRFHTSDPDCKDVRSYLWPALVDSQGVCVSRAVVIT
ncbi:uncharacterized protein [Littorina saxatilis]|uniref:uncharacterized protein n=1 Tax=Littorina saxatilis TaxID=31220 RepID=UPI0038B68FB6